MPLKQARTAYTQPHNTVNNQLSVHIVRLFDGAEHIFLFCFDAASLRFD